jgi:hypothetical protein
VAKPQFIDGSLSENHRDVQASRLTYFKDEPGLHCQKHWLLAHKTLLADTIQLNFRMDSQLVAAQLSGQWKIKDPKLQQLAEEVFSRLRQLPGTSTFRYIPREENKEADALANYALDKHS